MLNEKTGTDQFVREKLDEAHLHYDEQGSSKPIISEALKHASKRGNGVGKPEFIIDYYNPDALVIIEDKKSNSRLVKYQDNKRIDLTTGIDSPVASYALNGATYYAKQALLNSSYDKAIAVGVTGNSKDYRIQPVHVCKKNNEIYIEQLKPLKTFENFSIENFPQYYSYEVLGKERPTEARAKKLIASAKQLHEALRDYGQLKEEEKPLIVSGILVALESLSEQRISGLALSELHGSKSIRSNDGAVIYEHIDRYIDAANIPQTKKTTVLHQFRFIHERAILSEINSSLGCTPLKYFVSIIQSSVQNDFMSIGYDMLGQFYSEFISYTGGDGKGLGIVVTPPHVTELMPKLLDVQSKDRLLDTCCGTGGFLVSGMQRMFKQSHSNTETQHIREHQLYGIEMREDLFTMATTNMILRGDGKSNLVCDDYRHVPNAYYEDANATVGMINPPYSQAKTKDTQDLSEMNFILGILNRMSVGGRVGVIVPQSVMIGKNKYQKSLKKQLLKNHTLEAVITMPTELFYPVGTNTAIAIFTAKQPHPDNKRVKFINYTDDGYIKHKTLGRIPTEVAKDKEKYLLDVYFDRQDAPTSFMVKSTIKPEDEWLHSFYYFNDEIPTDADFEKTLQDYLAFKFDMSIHGRGDLFD